MVRVEGLGALTIIITLSLENVRFDQAPECLWGGGGRHQGISSFSGLGNIRY